MADNASRLFELTDSEFLSHFQQHYPQAKPWRLLKLPSKGASRLTSALRSKPPPQSMSRLPGLPRARRLASGPNSAPSTAMSLLLAASKTQKTDWPTSSSSSSATDDAPEKAVNPSKLMQYRRRYGPLERGSPTWVGKISASRMQEPKHTVPCSLISWPPSAKKKIPPLEPTRST